MLPELVRRPPLLELPAVVSSVGFAVDDHDAVVAQLSGLSFEGAPERAVSKRRAEFLAGRLAAAHALRALGFEAAPGRNPDGSPRWPALVVGSITHGAGRALCAVAKSSEVQGLGIDAERLLSPDSRRELALRICAETELTVLRRELALPEEQLVSLAFSAKESLFKCLYPLVEQYMDFGAARVIAAEPRSLGPGPSGVLTLELALDWSEAFPAGRRFEASFALAAQHVETAVLLLAP